MNFLSILAAMAPYLFFILLNNIRIKYVKYTSSGFYDIEYKGKNFK
ncbi:hypothetical protein [Clostridium sporogenes]|nr:hypothetical protein [Clostridium sporogenes]